MASRILHLAAAQKIMQRADVPQPERFRIGSILPDAFENRDERAVTHFILRLEGGAKTYDLTRFRALFGARLLEDGLYLGYYLHLIEDMVFRKIVYHDHHWLPDTPEKVRRLHEDYRHINAWAIAHYGLKDDLTAPENFSAEALYDYFPFQLEELLREAHADFSCEEDDHSYFFFTREMAQEFTAQASELCLRELEALRTGRPPLNEYNWTWGA